MKFRKTPILALSTRPWKVAVKLPERRTICGAGCKFFLVRDLVNLLANHGWFGSLRFKCGEPRDPFAHSSRPQYGPNLLGCASAAARGDLAPDLHWATFGQRARESLRARLRSCSLNPPLTHTRADHPNQQQSCSPLLSSPLRSSSRSRPSRPRSCARAQSR